MSINSKIKSPCIHVCTKDENGICLGCFRNMDEIREWYLNTDEQKQETIKRAENRRSVFDKKNPYL